MRSKLQGQCLLERVGSLKEIVYEDFQKKKSTWLRPSVKQIFFEKKKGNYMNRTSKMEGFFSSAT